MTSISSSVGGLDIWDFDHGSHIWTLFVGYIWGFDHGSHGVLMQRKQWATFGFFGFFKNQLQMQICLRGLLRSVVCGLMILAGICGSIEVGFCWSDWWYVVLLLILDDLDVLLLIWLGFYLLVLEICLGWNSIYLVEFVIWEMLEKKIFEYYVFVIWACVLLI